MNIPWGRICVIALTAIATIFIALPIVAIIAQVPPRTLYTQIGSTALLEALTISILSGLIGHAIVLLIGTPVAYALARSHFPGRRALITLLELPIVLPPSVAGIGLLAAFGRSGLLGGSLAAFGIEIPFTFAAVVFAAIFTSGSLYLRQSIAAFESIDTSYISTARTLGCSPSRIFRRIGIPLALPSLEAGSALALARGFGEFGATIMFAGNMPGVTQTLPLRVYALMDTDFDAALAAGTVLIALGIVLLIANRSGITWATSRRA